MASMISQHKKMAMGTKVTGMKKGGIVAAPKAPKQMMPFNSAPATAMGRKTGMPQSPITTEKATNSIPGMKKGGSMKC